ncbi:MAG: hypothetical protein ACOQNV_00830 [Mycoplasmoidaceae bacterium]
MKKHKLLMPIITSISTLGLAGSLIGAITSCSCHEEKEGNYIEAAKTDITIIGNNMAAEFQFTLGYKLASNEELTAEPGDDTGLFRFQPAQVYGRLVTVPVYWLQADWHEETYWKNSIIFTVKNKKSGSTIWKKTIKDCKVAYLPYCELVTQKEKPSSIINGKTITALYKFHLPNGIPSGYRTHLEAQTKDYDDEFIINEDDIEISDIDSENNVTVSIPATKTGDTGVVAGDTFTFDIQIYCMYDDTKVPIWISAPFTQLKCSYIDTYRPITNGYLTFEESTEYEGYCWLTGITDGASAQDFNALEIPSRWTNEEGTELKVLGVGDPDGDQPLNVPTSITTLIFGGTMEKPSEVGYFRPNVFKGCTSFKFIDASNIYNTAEDLQKIDFGADSFANWNNNGGLIIWGDEFSSYKRHMLIAKLYAAGLTNTNWYSITEVTTEQQLREACATGQNIKLQEDIIIAEPAEKDYSGQIDIKQSLVLDLNGHSVTSEAPIYNYDTKDFGIFGVWNGADVVVTDTSPGHGGSVKAYDQTTNMAEYGGVTPPTDEGQQNPWWNWSTEKNSYRPRECRCFYVRTDSPYRDDTSLEILAGNYWGNCTTIMNWNGSCWIEEPTIFRTSEHLYAPQFHSYTPYFDIGSPTADGDAAGELINCDNGAAAVGNAYFEIYGGKFYGVWNDSTQKYDFYDPTKATHDPVPDPDNPGKTKPANWLANELYRDLYDFRKETDQEGLDYNLVFRKP